jgi:hypothetical protein
MESQTVYPGTPGVNGVQMPPVRQNRTVFWIGVIIAISAIVLIAVAIWKGVEYSAGSPANTDTVMVQAPAATNLSNLTSMFTCAGSNAGAVATVYDSIGVQAFYGGYDSNGNALSSMTCPSGYTSSGGYNGYYTCTPANPKTPTFTAGAAAGMNACQKSPNFGQGSMNPPCPKNYTSVQNLFVAYPQPNTVCVPPVPPCPTGFTQNGDTCLPPASLGNPCPSGTQARGPWCVPN